MTSSSDEESTEHGLTLSDALIKTTYELLRQYESGSLDEFRLADGVAKLLRVAVLQSTDARSAVIELCEEISKRVQEKCIVEALAATALDIVAVGDSDDFGTVQSRIDNLVSQVSALEGGLLESLASCLTADGDHCSVMLLAEHDGGVIENGIDQALAEGIGVDVTIVVACEEMQSAAESMQKRLSKMGVTATAVSDAEVESAIRQCDIAIIRAHGGVATARATDAGGRHSHDNGGGQHGHERDVQKVATARSHLEVRGVPRGPRQTGHLGGGAGVRPRGAAAGTHGADGTRVLRDGLPQGARAAGRARQRGVNRRPEDGAAAPPPSRRRTFRG
ncbi:hypothetical protein FGB62_16g169 [Gracilaria domingensis]|nr:hypothetical protein FGB62_16g169 [Gracilaria domingensis]